MNKLSLIVASSGPLQDAIATESGLMELLEMAASEQDQSNRWRRYEELKRAGSRYVGWNASQAALRSPAIYQAFVEALDELLPVPMDEIA